MTQHTQPIFQCLRCFSDLLYAEIQAKKSHCEKCEKLIAEQRHRDQVTDSIHNANRRIRT